MEEIKVGDFARSKYGIIIKVGWVGQSIVIDEFDNITLSKTGGEIVKHSSNIIDLIEEGDYVNGTEVITVYGYDEYGNDKDELGIIEVVGEEAWGIYLTDIKEIKDIVTKEQFNQMKYIVGE